MSQCLRIVLMMDIPDDFLHEFIKKNARNLDLEGTAQLDQQKTVKIVACGKKEAIDQFLDMLHQKGAKHFLEPLEIEPFIKDRDYRGVFRIIE